ncbi:MAG: HD domain-containing protein [Bacteroidota bacterium]
MPIDHHHATCQYEARLIAKLKSLDTIHQLDYELIGKAVSWAKRYHGKQKRRSGEPFYSHPLEIAYMIASYMLKTEVIVTSILHDIVEDTPVTLVMIRDNFGDRIADMVDKLTRHRPDGNVITVEDMVSQACQQNDDEVLLIKLMDRLHNIQTLKAKDKAGQTRTIHETLQHFVALAMHFNSLELEQRIVSCVNKALAPEKRYHYFSNHYEYKSSILDQRLTQG